VAERKREPHSLLTEAESTSASGGHVAPASSSTDSKESAGTGEDSSETPIGLVPEPEARDPSLERAPAVSLSGDAEAAGDAPVRQSSHRVDQEVDALVALEPADVGDGWLCVARHGRIRPCPRFPSSDLESGLTCDHQLRNPGSSP
jgi:hypothetical protein